MTLLEPKRLLLGLGVLLWLTGCGEETPPTPFDGVVTDAADPLTAGGFDRLCELDIVESDMSYPASRLQASIIGPVAGRDDANVIVDFEVSDDGNGVVGAGDTLTLVEGDVPLWGPDEVGQEYTITLTADPVGPDRRALLRVGPWIAN